MAKKNGEAKEHPATKPISELAMRARSAPHNHWTISNRVPVSVGDQIVLARHNVKILEIVRVEDCYSECVVEVLGPVDGLDIPPLKYRQEATV